MIKKLSKEEIYGKNIDSCVDDNIIYYDDLTCVKINNNNITYYKLENPYSLKVNINKYIQILHRVDGPTIEYDNGDKYWYLNGKLHRENGPAIELVNGDKWWYLNGKRHREDGPAVEYDNTKFWYQNGFLRNKYWYLNGKEYTEKEFQMFLREKKLNRILSK